MDKFKKTYTLAKREYDGDPEYWDARQVNDVRSSAMQQGLRPTGDPSLAGKADDGSVVILTYTLPVEVALGADSDQAYEVTHAKVSPADQETMEAALAADVDPDKVDARVARENMSPEQAAKAVKSGKPESDDPEPGLSPQKVEPSTDAANEVEPAVSPKKSRKKAKQDEDALAETSGERQTSEDLAEAKAADEGEDAK